MIELVSSSVLPLVMLLVSLVILSSKKPLFDSFLSGAGEGAVTAAKLLPALCALIVSVEMLFASGIPDALTELLSGAAEHLGIPLEILPLLITRPVSGAASSATFSELLEEYGPDSAAALAASVIMGSSDTIVYIISVYFSSVGIKKTRHALPAAFLVMLFSILFSCFIVEKLL